MAITEEQIKRIQDDWSSLAGEKVTCEPLGSVVYGFCSEVGSLRLFKIHAVGPDSPVARGVARASYSPTMDSHFFSLNVE